MLKYYRNWPLMGLINLFLVIVIGIGGIMLIVDYAKGHAVDEIPALSEGKDSLQSQASTYNLFITSLFYRLPEDAVILPSTVVNDLPAERWMEWPVIPGYVSEQAKEVYRRGLTKGNNPSAFSVVGDRQSHPQLFLGQYDTGQYTLPAEVYQLGETITNFSGSFSRLGPAVIDGATPATMLARSWAAQGSCTSGEMPLECELRLHRPVIVFLNLGTHWTGRNPEHLRQIVDIILEFGAVPILATKADNLEGNFANNLEMARIAAEFDLPLWNLWALVQNLPNNGLDPIQHGGYMYLSEEGLARRRLSGLQMLDTVWRGLTEE